MGEGEETEIRGVKNHHPLKSCSGKMEVIRRTECRRDLISTAAGNRRNRKEQGRRVLDQQKHNCLTQ